MADGVRVCVSSAAASPVLPLVYVDWSDTKSQLDQLASSARSSVNSDEADHTSSQVRASLTRHGLWPQDTFPERVCVEQVYARDGDERLSFRQDYGHLTNKTPNMML